MRQRRVSTKKQSLLVPLLVFFISAIIVSFVISRLWFAGRESQKSHAKNLIQQIAYNFQNTMNEFFDITHFWQSYISKSNGDVIQFDSIAESIYSACSCIESIQLAPMGVITYSYPPVSDFERTNLFNDPVHRDDANYARLTQFSTVSGPFPQRRGGTGLTIRTPIYLTNNGKDVFWGFSIVTLRTEGIFKEANMPNLREDNYNYQLKMINTFKGKLSTVHCSTYNTLKDPVSHTFAISNTAWTLSVTPVNGWNNYSILIFELFVGFVFTVLVTFTSASLWPLIRQESTFKKLSYIDNLTKLHNSRKFYETLSELHQEEQPFAILYIDLNGFRPINDTYGHRSGDELLMIVAKKLKNCIREGDEVFRIGGDEFAILVPNQISIMGLSNLVQRIKASVERQTALGNATIQISAAIGYARYPQDGNTFEGIVQTAEEMMSTDKKNMNEMI